MVATVKKGIKYLQCRYKIRVRPVTTDTHYVSPCILICRISNLFVYYIEDHNLKFEGSTYVRSAER